MIVTKPGLRAAVSRSQPQSVLEGKPLTVEGKIHTKGIGTHGPSTIAFALPEGVAKFEAIAAIDDGGMIRDGKPSSASMRFRVYTQKPPGASAGGYDPDAPKVVPTDLFTVPEGLEVTIWATTPMLHNPTNIDFDAAGHRIWQRLLPSLRGGATDPLPTPAGAQPPDRRWSH